MREVSKAEDQLRVISIGLDTYDDIFSDFDPRDFSERNISDDFLYEVKKVSREDDFHVNELKLLLPQRNRNADQESIIAKRLHTHFRKNHHYFSEKKKSEGRRGLLMALAGTFLMVCASYVSARKSDNFLMHVLLVMLEPAGWFLVWIGLDNLIYLSRERKPELDFYTKMAKCRIVFAGS